MPEYRAALDLLQQLISFPTVSRHSNGAITDSIAHHLEALGFEVERTEYRDSNGVGKHNLVARRGPKDRAASPTVPSGLAYFCHTDVVPAEHWTGPGGDPFEPVAKEGRIYGRGACDMKGSLAAMVAAAASVSTDRQTAPLWIVCTADEEVGFEGAKHLVKASPAYRDLVSWQPVSLIGEPTRLSVVHAHKGIEAFRVTSYGEAAHSSTDRGRNANLAMVPLLQTLLEIEQLTRSDSRYQDARFDPPTLSWTFGVSDGCRAVNITPERSVAWVSLRPMPEIDGEDLITRVREQAERLGLEFERLSGGGPLWLDPDAATVQEMTRLTGGEPHTVCYSTDGGQFDELEHRLVCGPGDIAQAHTRDEWISEDQLERGVDLYRRAIERWCQDTD